MRRRTIALLVVVAAGLAAVGLVVVSRGDGDDPVEPTPVAAADDPVEGELVGTARTKTFDFDEASIETGTGEVSSVGMVELTIGDRGSQTGARVALGEFTGSPLTWDLDDTIYLDDGSLQGTGSCETTPADAGGFRSACTIEIVDGTSAYEGARGDYTYDCAVPSAELDVIVTCEIAGQVSY